MRLVKTDLFKINGVPMLAPDAGVKIAYTDIDASESGTDQAGNDHRVVIRYDAATWTFSYSDLEEDEYAYMKQIFPKAPDFTFTRPNPEDRATPLNVRACRTKRSISWKNAVTGRLKNYSFSIIECEDPVEVVEND